MLTSRLPREEGGGEVSGFVQVPQQHMKQFQQNFGCS